MTKKHIILAILFIFPIIIYLFFATGVYNFSTLPIISHNVTEVSDFKNLQGEPVTLKNKITVLGFLGDDLTDREVNVYNLHEKIYKGIHSSDEDFQMLMLLPEGTQQQVKEIINKLNRYTKISKWQFAFGTPLQIENVYNSLALPYPLDKNYGTDNVFIIDKELNLRCTKNDKKITALKGYNATSIAVLHKEMNNDVTVLLFEYNAALKSNYKINRRDAVLKINQKKSDNEK